MLPERPGRRSCCAPVPWRRGRSSLLAWPRCTHLPRRGRLRGSGRERSERSTRSLCLYMVVCARVFVCVCNVCVQGGA